MTSKQRPGGSSFAGTLMEGVQSSVRASPEAIILFLSSSGIPKVADLLELGGVRGIVGNVDPWRTVFGYRWRLRPLEARYPEPDRSVWVAEVRRYPRKASDFVLMENELRAVRELVLCEPGCRPFIEFHERLDVVEQSIESLGGELVFVVNSGDTMRVLAVKSLRSA